MPTILKTAVPINKSYSVENVDDSFSIYFNYIKIGDYYDVVRIITTDNGIENLESRVYSARIEKGSLESGKPTKSTSFEISIPDLIKEINRHRIFKGDLSVDVQKNINDGVVIENSNPNYKNVYDLDNEEDNMENKIYKGRK